MGIQKLNFRLSECNGFWKLQFVISTTVFDTIPNGCCRNTLSDSCAGLSFKLFETTEMDIWDLLCSIVWFLKGKSGWAFSSAWLSELRRRGSFNRRAFGCDMFIYDSTLITKYEVLELIVSDNACSVKEVHLSLAASWWPLNDKTKFVWDKKEFFSQFPSPEYNSSHFFQENPRRNTGFTSMMSRKKIQVLQLQFGSLTVFLCNNINLLIASVDIYRSRLVGPSLNSALNIVFQRIFQWRYVLTLEYACILKQLILH